jgi:hypothetical protein
MLKCMAPKFFFRLPLSVVTSSSLPQIFFTSLSLQCPLSLFSTAVVPRGLSSYVGGWRQRDQKVEKNSPIFENVAKTVAKIMKLKLKVQNGYIQLLLNAEISRTNLVLKMVITIKNVQVKSGQITKFCPIWSHWLKGCFAAQSARFSPWPTAARPPTSSARWSSGRLDFVYDDITSKWKVAEFSVFLAEFFGVIFLAKCLPFTYAQ